MIGAPGWWIPRIVLCATIGGIGIAIGDDGGLILRLVAYFIAGYFVGSADRVSK